MATIRCHPDTPLSRLLPVGGTFRPIFVHVPQDVNLDGLDWKIELDEGLEVGVITNEWGRAGYAVALPTDTPEPQWEPWTELPPDPTPVPPPREHYNLCIDGRDYPVTNGYNYSRLRRGPTLAELRRMTERQVRELPMEDLYGPQGRTNRVVNQPPQQAPGPAGGGDAAGGDGLVPGDGFDVGRHLREVVEHFYERRTPVREARRPGIGWTFQTGQGLSEVRYPDPPGKILGDSTQRTTARTGQGLVVFDESAEGNGAEGQEPH